MSEDGNPNVRGFTARRGRGRTDANGPKGPSEGAVCGAAAN